MPVPIDPFGNQNQMNDNQDDAETEARPMISRVNDPSFQSAHLPLPEENVVVAFFFSYFTILSSSRVIKEARKK